MVKKETKEKQEFTVKKLSLSKIRDFSNHPFRVKDDEEMDALVESIRDIGLIEPITVRPLIHGEYEIISGHRRRHAYEILGKKTIPCHVVPMLIEQATVMMVDSNLSREHILPSEKAFAYKMKLEAIKHQGKQTSDQVGQKSSVEMIAEDAPDSKSQIQRYIRLTNLIPEILQMVDDGRIALTPAVELSYLKENEQRDLLTTMEYDEVTPSLSQAQRLRRLSEKQGLTESEIMKIMTEVKGNQKEYIRFPADPIKRFFKSGTTDKEMVETLVKAMEYYTQHLERKNADRDAR